MIQFPAIPTSNARVPQTIGDVTYTLVFRWNARDSSWYFDVLDDEQVVIASSIRIVLGTYLGKRVDHVLFKNGVFVALDTSGQQQDAGLGDLGSRVVLLYFDVVEASLLQSGAVIQTRPGSS